MHGKAYEEILDHILTLSIVDTHEHLPLEVNRPKDTDVLAEWLTHYFSCDLVSAGLSDKDLATVRDSRRDLKERWALVEPYWHAARDTGYGRALAISARDLYGVKEINARTIGTLHDRFAAARAKGGHYAFVLKKKSRIAISIRDGYEGDGLVRAEDPFVFTIRCDAFITPTHYTNVRALGESVGVAVHTLEDWMEALRRFIDRHFDGTRRVVCLKSGLAYQRSLRYDKVTQAEAERDFHELFADRNLPAWRAPIKCGLALENFMQHHVCKLADERGLTYQFHTGIQEGNGNIISDANPVLLSNLFLEYGNVTFDVFHMGYPYMQELGNLAKNFRNVSIDMCWGHIISPEAARRALVEWLDAVPANKISAFGGDYCFVDAVYGHQHLARRNVAAALAQKVEDGTFDVERAKEIAGWLFVDNPRRLFHLEKYLPGKSRP